MSEPLIQPANSAAIGRRRVSFGSDGSWLGGVGRNEQMFQQYRGAIPVRQGYYPLARAEDPDAKKPVIKYKVHAKVFNLSKPEEVEEYEQVIQKAYDYDEGAELIACQVEPPREGVPFWSAFVQWRTSEILPPTAQGSEQYHAPR